MAEVWETLAVGFAVSLVFIGFSYLFWRRYDQPTPLMIERAEEKQRVREEQQTWREIEAKVRAEMAEAEERAWLDRQRAEKAARAMAPEPTEMSGAWASLGLEAPTVEEATLSHEPATPEFERGGEDKNAEHRAQVGLGQAPLEADDDDVFEAPEPVQVRQDTGVQAVPDAPDWELVDKLAELASKEAVELPDVPEAPDLDALAPTLLASDSTEEPAPPVSPTELDSAAAEDHEASGGEATVQPTEEALHESMEPAETEASTDEVVNESTEEEPWGEDDGTDPWSGTSW